MKGNKMEQTPEEIFKQTIKTENPGMVGGTSYYDIEEIYQAIKKRIITEIEYLNNKTKS